MSISIRQRRTKGIIAAACGVALLFTGGTFALWHDQDAVDGGLLTAGNLEIEAGKVEAWDISTNYAGTTWRGDQVGAEFLNVTDRFPGCKVVPDPLPSTPIWGHEIAFDDATVTKRGAWHPVPGDQFLIAFPLKIALEGDNMVAKLKADLSQSTDLLVESRAIYNLKATFCLKGVQSQTVSWVAEDIGVGKIILAELEAKNEWDGVRDAWTDPNQLDILMVNDVELPDKPNAYVFVTGTWNKESGGLEESADGRITKMVEGFEGTPTEFARNPIFGFTRMVVSLEQTRSNLGWFN